MLLGNVPAFEIADRLQRIASIGAPSEATTICALSCRFSPGHKSLLCHSA